VTFSDLPGWADEDHAAAFAAYRQGCVAATDPAMARVCRLARAQPKLTDREARAFFEANFAIDPAPGEGVMTAYFAPEYAARTAPDGEFAAPVRPKPSDLKPGAVYADRAAIEARPTDDALAWMRPEDLFFLQVQGSGSLAFPDGTRKKAGFAGANGQPYTAIGSLMKDRLPGGTSASAIHDWLAAHRGPEAQALMQKDRRYVFFRLAPDDGKSPIGTARVPLPAGRAIAVDQAYHPMGELLWLVADKPLLAGAKASYRRLVVTLDSGSAIKGPVRADLYLGAGNRYWTEASNAHHRLRLYRLAPK
jgi:membrane-bound lytic murein transglycosylase A